MHSILYETILSLLNKDCPEIPWLNLEGVTENNVVEAVENFIRVSHHVFKGSKTLILYQILQIEEINDG